MRLVSIKTSEIRAYTADHEMLHMAKRPCALIIRLNYKGSRYDFAVPIRSNINPSAPKNEYFALPPRPTTRPRCHHGVHYIKMFPVKRTALIRFRTEGNTAASRMKSILDTNEKQIIADCQRYLKDYEQGNRPRYATDIDLLISLM